MSCLSDMPLTNFHNNPESNELFMRFGGKVSLQGATSLFYFDKKGKLQSLLKALKYHNLPQVGRYLGAYLASELQGSGFLQGDETLIPVPLHRTKLASRGYNQSAAIAEGLQKGFPKVKIDTKSLVRARKTETQTRKSREERWDNVGSVFRLNQPVSGKIVLVDDVITTGATLESCIRVLWNQENPPESVKVIALGTAR